MGVFNKFSVDGGATFQEVEDENGRKMLAPIETDATSASKAYAVGEFLSLESTGKLYKVTAAIASGSAIVTSGSGANVTEDTVGGEIKSVKDNYTSKDLLNDTVGWTGKNLLPNNVTSQSINNVTFTVDSNKAITTHRTDTSSSSSILYLTDNTNENYLMIPKGKYILSDGKSPNPYAWIFVSLVNAGVIVAQNIATTENGEAVFDTTSYTYDRLYVGVRVGAEQSADVTFYPMIRRATEPAGYEPYHDSVKETLRDAEVIEGKNLMPFPYVSMDMVDGASHRGIYWTLNDQKVVANGTASDVSPFYLISADDLNSLLSKYGDLVLSGCPSGGGTSGTFWMYTRYGSGSSDYLFDTGSGVVIPASNTYIEGIVIQIRQGHTATNVTFSPMLCTKEEWDKSHEYKPYYEPLKDRKLDIVDQQVLGAWNLFNNTAVSQTQTGIPFVVNADKSISVNGDYQASGNTRFKIGSVTLDPGTYYLSGGANSSFYLWLYGTEISNAGGEDTKFTVLETTTYDVYITQNGTHTAHYLTFKPMIALEPNKPYVPWVMTNQELTDASVSNDLALRTRNLSDILRALGVTTQPASTQALFAILPRGFYAATIDNSLEPADFPSRWGVVLIVRANVNNYNMLILYKFDGNMYTYNYQYDKWQLVTQTDIS